MKAIYLVLGCGFFISCISDKDEAVDNSIDIPEIEMNVADSALSKDERGKVIMQNEPYSGYLVSYYDNGKLKVKSGYWQGLKEGQSIGYYPNGQQLFERPYSGGIKHGIHKGWYDDGSQKFIYFFEKGLSIGTHIDWYEDGSTFKEFNYKNGRPFGSQKVWRRDGKMRANYVIRENGRKYGLTGLKRCTKIDSETKNIDPYKTPEE